jgi:hypothetical protein
LKAYRTRGDFIPSGDPFAVVTATPRRAPPQIAQPGHHGYPCGSETPVEIHSLGQTPLRLLCGAEGRLLEHKDRAATPHRLRCRGGPARTEGRDYGRSSSVRRLRPRAAGRNVRCRAGSGGTTATSSSSPSSVTRGTDWCPATYRNSVPERVIMPSQRGSRGEVGVASVSSSPSCARRRTRGPTPTSAHSTLAYSDPIANSCRTSWADSRTCPKTSRGSRVR